MKQKKVSSIIWLITFIVILGLMASTVGLLVQANSLEDGGITGYIMSTDQTIYLHSEPHDTSQIVTILNRDTQVLVTNATVENNQNWLYVETETTAGWVPATNVGINTP
jgi:hypothetical protein